MPRDYGRISTAFWNSPDIRPLSDCGKLLASYLLTGPHSNMIGAYLLPDAYVADDLGWDSAGVRETLSELFRNGFAVRFKDGRHIVVCKYLEWNPIENPNVAVASLKMVDKLPDDPALVHVLNGLRLYEKHFRNGLETLAERLYKPFRNMEQEPEPEQEMKPEQDISSPQAASATPSKQEIVSRETPKQPELPDIPDCLRRTPANIVPLDQLDRAVAAYNLSAEFAQWPVCQRLTPARSKALRARLTDCGGIQGWTEAMERAARSSFLLGKTGRGGDHAQWRPDFDFFLQSKSFTKLMEGGYDDAPSNANSGSGLDRIAEAARYAHAQGDPDQRTA